MTIRDYIRRRVRIGYVLALVGVIIIAVGYPFSPDRIDTIDAVVAFLTFVPFFAAIAYLSVALRCPRCKGNLAVTPFAYPYLSLKRVLKFCPYCGVSVDEPCEPSRAEARR